jgi:uncharacterized surface protein with fasciclin (FAS1) repeats
MMRSRMIAAAVLSIGSLALVACGSDDSDSAESAETTAAETTAAETTTAEEESTATTEAAAPELDIVDTAVEAGSFTTLATLLTDAGLVETLKGDGPFTVFAPTDDAFAAVPQETLDALAADPDLLTSVLTYHVVAGEVPAADVTAGSVETLNGESIEITTDGGVTINGSSTVTTADVFATNGVIHVIDAVLLPPSVTG